MFGTRKAPAHSLEVTAMAEWRTEVVGVVLDHSSEWTARELTAACRVDESWLLALVDEGVVEPIAGESLADWRFTGVAVTRVQRATRLTRDLGVNLAGVALALDLIDELSALRRVR
ncbi:chaperone modulator CbpM [Arhodomonas sp. AD133]|uniref:chaperone modulator CbpM n=1 Tax=Arhodomonas sp. AD133 TaxID=3415009 RepID=UPI003EB9F5FE